MKKFFCGLATLPFLAGVALAGQPVPLNDGQMDKVTAGFDFLEINHQNLGNYLVAANFPPLGAGYCGTDGGCFLSVTGTTFPGGTQSLQVYAGFGPNPQP
jgi:hypothetical protein